MTIRHLTIFLCVIDEAGISNAARKLFISQPSVSQAIAEIEQEYNCKLFDRLSKKLHITDTGRYLEGYARHIVKLFSEMEQNMMGRENRSIIRVGASLTVGSTVLPQVLQIFQSMFPDTDVFTSVKNTHELEYLLLKNEIDIALVEGVLHTGALTAIPFMQDEVILVCGRNHPLYGRSSIQPQELAGAPFLLREKGSGTRELFESVMSIRSIPFRQAWECASPDGIINAAIQGFGIGVISRSLVQPELQAGSLCAVAVQSLQFTRPYCIVYHKNKYLSSPLRALSKICSTAFSGNRPQD